MATIKSVTYSPMCGNPIIVSVLSKNISPASTSVLSFHRLVVDVTVNASLRGATVVSDTKQSFATAVEDAETVDIDISSALRAVADSLSYTADQADYALLSYTIAAHDEYRLDGNTYNDADPTTYGETLTAFNGTFSDMERIMAGQTKAVGRWTRKPKTSPLIVAVGETVPYCTSTSIPPEVSIKSIEAEGLQTVGDFSVYALPAASNNNDRYQFRFINGLGVLDSFSCYALGEQDTEIESTEYELTTLETFNNMSHGIVRKSNDYDSLKLTSGPLDRDWLDWFVHEFLRAEYMWMRVYTNAGRTSSTWIRCTVEPSDTIKGMNRAKTDVTTIDFTCKLDITGSMNVNLMA